MKNVIIALTFILTAISGAFATACTTAASHSYVTLWPAGNTNGNEQNVHRYHAASLALAKEGRCLDTVYGVSDSTVVTKGAAALSTWDFAKQFSSAAPQNTKDRVTGNPLPVHADSIVCYITAYSTTSTADTILAGVKYKLFDSTYVSAGSGTFILPASGAYTIARITSPLIWGAAYLPWYSVQDLLTSKSKILDWTCGAR